MTISIRRATRADMPSVLGLIQAHAAYERSGPVAATVERLGQQLVEGNAAVCLVAAITEAPDRVVGYTTASPEFSTWNAEHYLHMDTLFVDEASRGQRIGQAMFDAIVEHGNKEGFREVQWQTPEWNTDAIRFYERAGAEGTNKRRFALSLTTLGERRQQR